MISAFQKTANVRKLYFNYELPCYEKKIDQNTECYINIDFCIFTQVTTSTITVIHANDFAQLNALKIKSNVAKNKLQQAAYKTISAFTKDLIGITLSFVTDFAQSNVKMMKWNAQ